MPSNCLLLRCTTIFFQSWGLLISPRLSTIRSSHLDRQVAWGHASWCARAWSISLEQKNTMELRLENWHHTQFISSYVVDEVYISSVKIHLSHCRLRLQIIFIPSCEAKKHQHMLHSGQLISTFWKNQSSHSLTLTPSLLLCSTSLYRRDFSIIGVGTLLE